MAYKVEKLSVNNDKTDLVVLVVELMRAEGMSIDQVVKESGVAEGSLRNYLSGRATPNRSNASKLISLLTKYKRVEEGDAEIIDTLSYYDLLREVKKLRKRNEVLENILKGVKAAVNLL